MLKKQKKEKVLIPKIVCTKNEQNSVEFNKICTITSILVFLPLKATCINYMYSS